MIHVSLRSLSWICLVKNASLAYYNLPAKTCHLPTWSSRIQSKLGFIHLVMSQKGTLSFQETSLEHFLTLKGRKPLASFCLSKKYTTK